MLHTAIIILIAALAVLYVVLCPRVNYALYRPLMFHPVGFGNAEEASAPELSGVTGQNITFKNDRGEKLWAWYYNQPGAKYTVLLSHGNGGNMGYRTDTVSLLLDAGLSVLIYDYRGYGNSEGLPHITGICQDGLAAYSYLNQTCGIADDHIILYGESLGCSVTTNISTQKKCAGMILQSGFVSLYRIATEFFPVLRIYPGKLLSDPTMDNLSIVKLPHPPLLIMHGHLDQTVPFSHAKAIFSAACEPKRFLDLPQCGHCDICSEAQPEFSKAIAEFVQWIDKDPNRSTVQPGVSSKGSDT